MNSDNFFETQMTANPLVETGNQQAADSPFGKDSMFNTNLCGEFIADFYGLSAGETNVFDLIQFLKKDRINTLFNWKDIQLKRDADEQYKLIAVPTPPALSTYVAPPIRQPLEPYEFFSARINKRICEIGYVPAFNFEMNLEDQSVLLMVKFYYADIEEFVTYSDRPALDGTVGVAVEDKYVAVELVSADIEAYAIIVEELGVSSIRALLKDYFKQLRKKVNRDNLEELNWFYTILPDFVIESFDKSDLWNDLKKLLDFDESKWFEDNSVNIVKVIKGIAAQDNGEVYLYDQFYEDPKFIKDIYSALDGDDKYGGSWMPSKSVFASLMLAVTYAAYGAKDLPFDTVASFTFSETMRVDSNIVFPDSSDTSFNLTQEAYKLSEAHMPAYASEGSSPTWIKVGETHVLHPLALVNVTFPMGDGEPITVPFPAIMVKDMAYKAEWERVNEMIRFGLNVLAIVLGVITLVTTGNPALILLAIADIGLAATDIVVQAFKDPLMKTELGQEFLAAWEKVYVIGGLITAIISAPQLIQSLFSAGARLIRSAIGATKTFLKQVLVSIILEINIANFSKIAVTTVDIGSEILKDSKVVFRTAAVERLEREGVVFVRMIDESGVEQYSAVYRGEVLVPNGTAQELKQSLNTVWNKTGDKLLKGLDDLQLDLAKRNLNGIKLTKLEYKAWKIFIHNAGGRVRNIRESPIVAAYFEIKKAGAAFEGGAGTPTIWVRGEHISDLEMFHETMHFEDFLRRGRRNYIRGSDDVTNELAEHGIKMKSTKRDQLISSYIKERYVLKRILEEQASWQKEFGYGRFTKKEIRHSKRYFVNKYYRPCVDAGIDVLKIKIKQ